MGMITDESMWTIIDGPLRKCAECGRHEPEHASTCEHATVENSPALKLVKSFTDYREMRDVFQHRFVELLNAKGVKFDNYEDDGGIILTDVESARFSLKTEYTVCGDTDHTTTWFPLSDLDVDVAELNRRTEARIAKEKTEREQKEAAYQLRQQDLRDERDRQEYVRLKQKFGDA